MRTVHGSPQPKAYSYIRFSTPQQAKGDSHRRQADKAARYAAEHGLVLDGDLNLTDLGVSAYRGKNVKTGALGVFLRAVEDETVPRGSFLLVENIDRLSRDDISDATALFLQIINAGVVVVTLTNRERYSRERLATEPHAIYFIISELIRANQGAVDGLLGHHQPTLNVQLETEVCENEIDVFASVEKGNRLFSRAGG